MAARHDDPTRTARASSVTSVDPALDATLPSPGARWVSPAADELQLAPGTSIGRYVVRDQLGAGGMGVVYRVHDPELGRDLAAKVVLPQASGARAQQRLLDEARAMAKLRHPSVVPVYDVGTTADGVYVVMPLVRGGTLHDWLRAGPRPWRQVVERFLAAGRGLAAAHDAGLVHRDFKPRNVLIGDDGAVLVADFGLAAEVAAPTDDTAVPAGSVLTSSVAGTPAYMAPEQARGTALDARADQFSFCVSFWEGLHGERPHEAETRTRVGLPALRSPAALPPVPDARRGAPRWLLAAIARGFSPAASRRWPTMHALLRHIEGRLRRPRRIATFAAALAVAGVTVALALASPDATASRCTDGRSALASVWNAQRQASIRSAFASTGSPLAGDAFERVQASVERYAADWRAMHLSACKATREQHTQSEQLLVRRARCLDRRRDALDALTRTFAERPSLVAVAGAPRAARDLPAIAECADTERLLAAPPDLADATQRARVAKLDRELDDLRAELVTQAHLRLVGMADATLAHARALGDPTTLGRALDLAAHLRSELGVDIEPFLRERTRVTAEAKDDRAHAASWIELMDELARAQARFRDAVALEPVAQAALLRAGSPDELAWRFAMAAAAARAGTGENTRALDHLQRAVELAREPEDQAESQLALAWTVASLEGMAAARARFTIALQLAQRAHGAGHPLTVDALLARSEAARREGDLEAGRRDAAEAVRILERNLGAGAAVTARALRQLAAVERAAGQLDLARTLLDRAVVVGAASLDRRELADALEARADLAEASDDLTTARGDLELALRLTAQLTPANAPRYLHRELRLAAILVLQGSCDVARTHLQHAARELPRTAPADAIMPLALLGRCELQTGSPDAAIDALTRADRHCREHGCEAALGHGVRLHLGRGLVESGRDAGGGAAMVRDARRGLTSLHDAGDGIDVVRWLHGLQPVR